MVCQKCGSELLDNVQFCSKCGNAIEVKTEAGIILTDRKRHGFTTFWLILSIIIPIISGITSFVSVGILPGEFDSVKELTVFSGIVTISIAIGCIFLLRWKKIGFWLYAGISIIPIFSSVAMAQKMMEIVGEQAPWWNRLSTIAWSIISIAIMWGVLHIRKNGKTTWEQLVPISKLGWF